jgi:hypothetical protein
MNQKHTNPSANVPAHDADEPRGDRGKGDRTWTLDQGEQGISSHPDDQAADAEPDEDDEFDDDEDADEEEDDEVDEDSDEQEASRQR